MDCITEDPIPFPPDGMSDDANDSRNDQRAEEEREQPPSVHTASIGCKTQDDDDISDDTVTMCHLGEDASLNKAYRVKLYELSDDGNWKDEGTGTIQFKLCRDEAMMKSIEIRVISEEEKQNEKILLQHTALSDILYDKQGDSIIQWLDGGKTRQIERAISFQHKSRCLELWRLIAYMKGHRKVSQFEAETRKHKNSANNNNNHNNNTPQMEFEDVEMNETDTDANGLVITFLNDHNDIDINIESKKEEEEEESDSSDDDDIDVDDGGTQFLEKLTMRTQKKAKKNKVEIPTPTAHNLWQLYGKVKHAVEGKDIGALNELGSAQWREALYGVFTSIEENASNANGNEALEYIFMIVLECCRECEQIQLKKVKRELKRDNKRKSDFAKKISAIRQQQLGYIMHTSFAQLLSCTNGGHSMQDPDGGDSCTLMMIFLGKEFISKTIAMLEYDPIARSRGRARDKRKHRNFLKHARRQRLSGIEMADGDELYDEIEYIYKLNYVRDCVLLGKLDLEQQAFHILNHHIARYNTVICETIAQDTRFMETLFTKIRHCGDDDAALFRFLSEFLCRIKSINDASTRSAIFMELIQNGLLDTLSDDECGCVKSLWLILVECVHHMIASSSAPCGNAPQVRAFIVKQMNENPKRKTLLQRLCSAFQHTPHTQYNEGILDQIYYIMVGLLGLDDLIGLDAAQGMGLAYLGLPDRDVRSKHLKLISAHFFDECVPLFYRVLHASNRYQSHCDSAHYPQMKAIQKHVINLLSACCQQEQFMAKLKELEEKYDLMSSIHNLIYVPKAKQQDHDLGIRNQDLSMCCVRFLRECLHLAQHDAFWSTRIKNYGLFKNVMSMFECNGLETYNMMNSTILSVFASIEDKKIEDIILYLGDEQILQKYTKLIHYTTAFADLSELYEKAKHGIPIQSQIDEQSTATLSNCSSLSPRISPNAIALSSPQEIHYFDAQHENCNKKYKDSPRPNLAQNMNELKLPNRKEKKDDEQSFDLLTNANANANRQKQKRVHKRFNLSIGNTKEEEREKEMENAKESSPFLLAVCNAMDPDPGPEDKEEDSNTHTHTHTNGIKRKYCDISVQHVQMPSRPKKKIKLMNGSGTHDTKLKMNSQHPDSNPDPDDMYHVNESPDTFDDDNAHQNHCYVNGNSNMNGNCTKSILLNNSKTHSKHNKHVHFESDNDDDMEKKTKKHPNPNPIHDGSECITLHSEIVTNNIATAAN